jgi:hypothetical protein
MAASVRLRLGCPAGLQGNCVGGNMRSFKLTACLVAIAVSLLLPACSHQSATGTGEPPPITLTTGSTTPTFILPFTLEPAPQDVTALGLWNEFKTDESAAMAKYEGKTLHFARVRVDRMSFLGEGADPELYIQEGIEPGLEMVKFRTDLVNDIINVRETYIVELTGKVQGMQFGYLIVRISWLKVVDPPGGDTKPPAEY